MLRPTLYNLGDAISRDGDPAAPALIDVGAPGGPRTGRSRGHLPAVVWQAQRKPRPMGIKGWGQSGVDDPVNLERLEQSLALKLRVASPHRSPKSSEKLP